MCGVVKGFSEYFSYEKPQAVALTTASPLAGFGVPARSVTVVIEGDVVYGDVSA
ncbi:MAG: hypothetical protein J6L64_03860 [Opitutales bacterium]|nr:hypothetical protein [Opitutales bacterium]